MLGRNIGLKIDSGKIGTCSVFLLTDMLSTLFYYTCYRMLFEESVSFRVFALVQADKGSGYTWLNDAVRAVHKSVC